MAAGVEGADVVHSHTWYANLGGHLAQADVRHPARGERAQPRAAAALEGRAARRRLRGVEVLRADGDRARRRGDRRVARHARRHPRLLSGRRPGPRAGHLQRHRHATSTRPTRARTCSSASASTRPARPSSSSGASRARRAWSTCWRRRAPSTPRRSSCCARARRTRRSSGRRSRAAWTSCRPQRDGVLWIAEMLPKPHVIQLLSHATVFACPSIYEPLGIVNLEAMACEAAVVATATGGIVEVVVDGETGLLVPFEPSDDGLRTPVDPAGFAAGIAARVNELVARPGPRGRHGQGRPPARARPVRLAGDRRSRRPSSTARCANASTSARGGRRARAGRPARGGP